MSGNLDEAYTNAADVNDCDTDADAFHHLTSKMALTDIKTALLRRFRPEQIARLGNNHIIYPSLSKSTYQRIIRETVNVYVNDMTKVSNVTFNIKDSTYDVLYQNSVFPTQGTRPVFSSVHTIFSDGLVKAAFWALEGGYASVDIELLSSDEPCMRATAENGDSLLVPVNLDLDEKRKRVTMNERTVVSVHEAGHAALYMLLFKRPPFEVKVNSISFSRGYTMPDVSTNNAKVGSANDSAIAIRNRIAVLWGGRAAEMVVFGQEYATSGASADIRELTAHAAALIRMYSLGPRLGLECPPSAGDVHLGVPPTANTNKAVSDIIESQYSRAIHLLTAETGRQLFQMIVEQLLEHGVLDQSACMRIMAACGVEIIEEDRTYINMWNYFRKA